MKRRGQFYLIATIILIVIIFGFITVSNYLKKQDSREIYYLGEELKIESAKVLDYETYKEENKLNDFMANFSKYAGQDIEIIYIISEIDEIKAYKYEIKAYKYINGVNKGEIEVIKDERIIKITVEDIDYEFDLNPGKNFYFIISQKTNKEKYIVTN